eukprot:5246575-Amphidinium_carterae.1
MGGLTSKHRRGMRWCWICANMRLIGKNACSVQVVLSAGPACDMVPVLWYGKLRIWQHADNS